MARFNSAPTEQNPSFPFRNAAGHNLGVLIVDLPAKITDIPFPIIPLRYSETDRGGALAAIFHTWVV